MVAMTGFSLNVKKKMRSQLNLSVLRIIFFPAEPTQRSNIFTSSYSSVPTFIEGFIESDSGKLKHIYSLISTPWL